jgi:hypothetical protein
MATKRTTAASTKKKASYSLISDDTFRKMLSSMTRLRTSSNRLGARNLEAVLIGTTLDLKDTDFVITPAGVVPARHIAAFKHAVASPALGAGTAWALQSTNTEGVVIAFGDAANTTREVWLEAFTLAGKHHLPVLFVLLPGNGEAEIAAAEITSDAVAAGVISIPVDQSDVVAIYRVAYESLARARRRTGATLIVSTHYKLEGSAPSASNDPIAHLKTYLKAKGIPARP